jgi:hypothetical protein
MFTEGMVITKSGTETMALLNYNMLTNEFEFLQNKDTLAIAKKKDLKMIIMERDTFIYIMRIKS